MLLPYSYTPAAVPRPTPVLTGAVPEVDVGVRVLQFQSGGRLAAVLGEGSLGGSSRGQLQVLSVDRRKWTGCCHRETER